MSRMTQSLSSQADLPLLEPVVTVLQCTTALELDPGPLEELFATQGELAAEDLVCRVLEDISARLAQLKGPRQRAAFDEMVRPSERIAAIAQQIGLIEVAKAARHVAVSASQYDGIAMEATMTRLERAFDMAISNVWNFQSVL